MSNPKDTVRVGLAAAIGAYLLWGVFPIFWKQLGKFDPLQVVGHRVIWSFLILTAISFWFLQGSETRKKFFSALLDPKVWRTFAIAGLMIASNWLAFVWAMSHDRVVQASLGYYINPLFNVLLGVVLLGERLNKMQWFAIAMAASGVVIFTVALGGLPWVSLVLAVTFALYSLVKKKATLPALQGLYLETTVLLVPAVVFLGYVESTSQDGAFQSGDLRLLVLLVLGGTVTIAPLALFAFAAKRAPLSSIGVLQYIAPTMQFLLGVCLYGEEFDTLQLVGFSFVWLALAVYLWSSRSNNQPVSSKDTEQ
ncbi:MAG: EamA family transporter RarD [Planctomycetota bacterium]|nr:EamA family transporter RarD [Planctomycetota bacterium]